VQSIFEMIDKEIPMVPCSRCGRVCVVRGPGKEDATLLRLAETPENGLCVDCSATSFLKSIPIIVELLDEKGPDGPKAFLSPHMQEQFADLMRAGHADAKPEEINWENVVAHWPLPMPGEKRRKRK
jgi:hypothetical protein